ncbi:MAG: hypothetical protein JNJ58_10220 [Chitinophagaceae bacterium]|nr:hypothetical protein [Chitinophagaceae bacterium]
MSKAKNIVRYRDANDGQYITKKQAEQKPSQSVKETDKPKPKPVPKKK